MSTMSTTLETSVSKNECREILDEFFLGVSFEINYDPDPSLEKFLIDSCLSHGVTKETAVKLAKLGAALAKQYYPLHSPDLQRLIGLYTSYFFLVDDLGPEFLDDIRNFGRNATRGMPQNPFLKSFAALLPNLDQYYPGLCSSRFTTGLIHYMDFCALEIETTGKFLHLPTSKGFPVYFRRTTGLPESWTFFTLTNDIWSEENMNLFLQATPDMIDFTNAVNDLLSYYKESTISDERNTYIYHRALADEIPVSEVLRCLVTEIHNYIDNIKTTVSDSPTLLEVVDRYLGGLIQFHVMQPRYKLCELEIPSLMEKMTQNGQMSRPSNN